MRFVIGTFAAIDLFMGVLLLRHAWENSWFSWSPPDSNVWYTEFRPYVTFYPGLLLLVLSAVTTATLAADLRKGRGTRAWMTASALTHLALGQGMLIATFALFSFLFICADPGGCHVIFDPYPPIAIPSLILFIAGALGSSLDLMWRRRETTSLPASSLEQ